MGKICILIPAYNEEKSIGRIINELRSKDFPVYVVDDGSTDNTYAAASSAGAIVIKNGENMGKGAAMRAGFERILKDDYDAVVVMDGDDQHDIPDIYTMINKMGSTGAGMIVGNRMGDTKLMPYIRIVVNNFMSYLLSKISGSYVPDTQCGFRLIKSEVLRSIELKCSKFEIESEMIIKAARAGFRIESVPIKTVYGDEKSRINPVIDTLRFIRFLITMR